MYSYSSVTNKNKEDVHLWPREYFSPQLKHKPCSRWRANSDGVNRLKGMVAERGLVTDGSRDDSGEGPFEESEGRVLFTTGGAVEGGLPP